MVSCERNDIHEPIIFIDYFGELTCQYFVCYDRMAKVQELIAQQTDITASDQYLLFENVRFSEFVEPMELAKNYPLTSDVNPVFLFPSNADSLRLPTLHVRK